jgi:hypothetical protein
MANAHGIAMDHRHLWKPPLQRHHEAFTGLYCCNLRGRYSAKKQRSRKHTCTGTKLDHRSAGICQRPGHGSGKPRA